MTARTLEIVAIFLFGSLSVNFEAFAGQTSRHSIDGPTGASITVTRQKAGTATIDVVAGRVHIRKEVVVGRTVTTIASGRDRLTVTIDRAGIAVTTPTHTAAARLIRPEAIGDVVSTVARSAAAADGRVLLARLDLDSGSVEGQALLLTRRLLESAVGDVSVPVAVPRWMSTAPRGDGQLIPARFGQSATDCWNSYVSSAVQTTNSYINCYYSVPWYDIFDRIGCAALYDIQSEGNWLWYLNCVGAPLPMFGVS